MNISVFDRLSDFSAPRKWQDYSICELLTAGIAHFLFKEGSRNAMNLYPKEAQFRRNYYRVFKQRLPHTDVVDDPLRGLKEGELGLLQAALIGQLMEKKVLHRFKAIGRSFNIAIDGVHMGSYSKDYCGECLSKQLCEKSTV